MDDGDRIQCPFGNDCIGRGYALNYTMLLAFSLALFLLIVVSLIGFGLQALMCAFDEVSYFPLAYFIVLEVTCIIALIISERGRKNSLKLWHQKCKCGKDMIKFHKCP